MIEILAHIRNERLKVKPQYYLLLSALLILPLVLMCYQYRQFDLFENGLETFSQIYNDPNAYHFVIDRDLQTTIPLFALFITLITYLFFGLESHGDHWKMLMQAPINLHKLLLVKFLFCSLLLGGFAGVLVILIQLNLHFISRHFEGVFTGFSSPSFIGIIFHYLFFSLKFMLFQALVFHLLRQKLWLAFFIGLAGPFLIFFNLNPYNIHYRLNQSDYLVFWLISLGYTLAFYVIYSKTIRQ